MSGPKKLRAGLIVDGNDHPGKFINAISGAHTFSFNKGLVVLDVVRLERTSH